MVSITSEPITADPLVAEVSVNTSGAVAVFVGIAREFTEGRKVIHLEYEAYREMALKKMGEIEAEVLDRWQLDRVAMVHRVGTLSIGEASIIIAISAPHRKDALEACHCAIDRVKEIVPIWKKEVFEDASRWVASEALAGN